MAIDFNIYYLDESLFEVKLIDGKCNSLVIYNQHEHQWSILDSNGMAAEH